MAANLDTIGEAYEAFAAGNVPAVLAILDPKVEWIEAEGTAYRGTFEGPDAVLENVFMRLGTEWDGFSVTPHEFIDGGDQVVVLGRYGGAFKETSKSLDCDFCHVWDLRDGKAVRFRQYVDSAALNEAMTS